MLQAIRERAQGWIAWVIILLISIPFALWGIQSYLDIGGEPSVASVNGQEIAETDLSRRVQQTRINLREQLGTAFDPALLDDARLRAEVLDDMIRERLLFDVSTRLGMRVADDDVRLRILAEPAFQRDGRFDRDTYERLLRMQGLSPAGFEAGLRQQLIGGQLPRAVVATEFITQAERAAQRRFTAQRRELGYARLAIAGFMPRSEEVTDDEIQSFHAANTARFQTPEQVRLEYLVLDAAALAETITIGEDELRRQYDSDPTRFTRPERRAVRHLLLTLPADADAATAAPVLERIQALRARMLAGESFAALATEASQDPGSREAGGALGTIEAGAMDPVFDQATFALAAGTVSEPVRTRFGYHLILVDSILPASTQPFEEVRERLRGELATQRAETLFYDLSERLATLVYESPDSLEPAAQALGLTIQASDWIGRAGGQGLLAQPRLLAAAFSDDVLVERANSELIEPERDRQQAVVLRVIDHRAAAIRPLDEVRDEIRDELLRTRAHTAARAAADQALARLRDGVSWSEALPGGTLEQPGLVDRQASGIPAPVLKAAFTLPRPVAGQASFGQTLLDDGDIALIQVTRVEDGSPDPAAGSSPATDMDVLMLSQTLGRHLYEAMLNDMARRATITRDPSRAGAREAL